jgi:hypothetical protein
VLAALVVVSGLLVVSPSFNFDSDRDGVADVTEVYERGTDPAKPDATFNPTLVQNSNKG